MSPKNTKRWLNEWLPKIKQDGKMRRAQHLIIETRTLPGGVRGYCERDGVLVCQPDYAEALIHVLRMWMIAAYPVEDSPVPDEQALWEYLDGEDFRERLDALRKVTKKEDDALVEEERAHKRWWGARANRAGVIHNAVAGIEGDIQEIAGAPSDDQNLQLGPAVEDGCRSRSDEQPRRGLLVRRDGLGASPGR